MTKSPRNESSGYLNVLGMLPFDEPMREPRGEIARRERHGNERRAAPRNCRGGDGKSSRRSQCVHDLRPPVGVCREILG